MSRKSLLPDQRKYLTLATLETMRVTSISQIESLNAGVLVISFVARRRGFLFFHSHSLILSLSLPQCNFTPCFALMPICDSLSVCVCVCVHVYYYCLLFPSPRLCYSTTRISLKSNRNESWHWLTNNTSTWLRHELRKKILGNFFSIFFY